MRVCLLFALSLLAVRFRYLMFVVWCFFASSCSLFVVRCLHLLSVCSFTFVVCRSFVLYVRCLVSVVWRSACVARCRLYVVCCLLFVVC